MDEARRFLRYVTPGLTFAVQALLLLFIVNPQWTLDRIGELKEDAGAGLAFALFLASGGIGYLLSVVHHTLHHTLHDCKRYRLLRWLPLNWTRRWLTVVDHTKVINELLDADLLDVLKFDRGTIVKIDRTTDEIDRTTAWVMVTAVWKENLKDDSRIHSADACATGLTDITHSAGAARIGAIFALVVVVVLVGLDFFGWLGRHGGLGPPWWPGLIAILIGSLLVGLHHGNYLRSGKLMERFIHEVLLDALWARKTRTGDIRGARQEHRKPRQTRNAKPRQTRNTKPAAHRHLCGAVRPDRVSIGSNRRQHMRAERVKRSSPWRAIRASSRPS